MRSFSTEEDSWLGSSLDMKKKKKKRKDEWNDCSAALT